ncbi:Dof-type zinc finger DNA-binding family protein [Striga asiatica]|uniref:Dof-type zinc finger DNA-binding family protein n=1 Tax=Striga asiatica TaxID=4170 RepID=A0A5A7PLV9_STRAF|nr:Dof-type zinc finger DNA-binding family protein [Striga asiatica]
MNRNCRLVVDHGAIKLHRKRRRPPEGILETIRSGGGDTSFAVFLVYSVHPIRRRSPSSALVESPARFADGGGATAHQATNTSVVVVGRERDDDTFSSSHGVAGRGDDLFNSIHGGNLFYPKLINGGNIFNLIWGLGYCSTTYLQFLKF